MEAKDNKELQTLFGSDIFQNLYCETGMQQMLTVRYFNLKMIILKLYSCLQSLGWLLCFSADFRMPGFNSLIQVKNNFCFINFLELFC